MLAHYLAVPGDAADDPINAAKSVAARSERVLRGVVTFVSGRRPSVVLVREAAADRRQHRPCAPQPVGVNDTDVMVQTGRRAGALRSLLEDAGLRFRQRGGALRMDDLRASARSEVLRIHASLGGLSATPNLRPGTWDLQTLDGLAIELDEEFHFTRYRATTLRQPILQDLPWTASYLTHCVAYEGAATKGGGRWTSPSTEKMFGPSAPVGVFREGGSARGKQRALYDAMKDVAAATGTVRLARIAIYDEVDDVTLGDILYGKRTASPKSVRQAVEARVHQLV